MLGSEGFRKFLYRTISENQKITGKIGASFTKDANTTYTGDFDVNLIQ